MVEGHAAVVRRAVAILRGVVGGDGELTDGELRQMAAELEAVARGLEVAAVEVEPGENRMTLADEMEADGSVMGLLTYEARLTWWRTRVQDAQQDLRRLQATVETLKAEKRVQYELLTWIRQSADEALGRDAARGRPPGAKGAVSRLLIEFQRLRDEAARLQQALDVAIAGDYRRATGPDSPLQDPQWTVKPSD